MIRYLINKLEQLDSLTPRQKERAFKYAYFIGTYVIGYFLFSWVLANSVPHPDWPNEARMYFTVCWIISPISVPLCLIWILFVCILFALGAAL